MPFQLDFRTLSLTLMLFSLLFGLGMFLYARVHNKFSGITTIGTGYLMIGLGCTLVGLRHLINDFTSIVIANLIICLGVILVYKGLFSFLAISLRLERFLSPLLLLFLLAGLYYYSTYIPDINRRIEVFSTVFAALCFIGAFGLLLYTRTHNRAAVRVLTGMFVLVGAFHLFRVVWTTFDPPQHDFMTTGLLSSLAVISGELLVILSSFATLWMATDELQNELSTKARVDPLTHLFNRRAFEESCDMELSRAQGSGTTFCILICDLDHFKQVNDQYGHQIGDEVLKRFAATLSGNVRKQDILARFGGEEFVLLMPDTNTEQGLLAAEHLRARTQTMQVAIDSDVNLNISASFGVAHYSRDDVDWSTVLHRADSALYAAKEQGRNKAVGLPSGGEALQADSQAQPISSWPSG